MWELPRLLKKGRKNLKEVLFNEITAYVNENYVVPDLIVAENFSVYGISNKIEDSLKNMRKSFSDRLFEMIREKNLSDSKVYKEADIDRRHFSKIRSDSDYRPKKDTVIMLCFSMKLSYEEAQDLLACAGFTLSKSIKKDVVAEAFFMKKNYDVSLYKEYVYKMGL